MKLVDDWKDAWKWHSVWIAAVLAALPVAWASMPADLKSAVPDTWLPYISGVMFLAFLVGRVRAQK